MKSAQGSQHFPSFHHLQPPCQGGTLIKHNASKNTHRIPGNVLSAQLALAPRVPTLRARRVLIVSTLTTPSVPSLQRPRS